VTGTERGTGGGDKALSCGWWWCFASRGLDPQKERRAQGTRAAGCFQCAIGRKKGHKNANFGLKKKNEALRFDATVGGFSSDGL
jgi:hypothetical protein